MARLSLGDGETTTGEQIVATAERGVNRRITQRRAEVHREGDFLDLPVIVLDFPR